MSGKTSHFLLQVESSPEKTCKPLKSPLHEQQISCHREIEMVLFCGDSLHVAAAFSGDR